jgi:hypothetical protein
VEFLITGEEEYEEVVEEYEEEILVQEVVPELADAANTVPAQGKPRCITLIFLIIVYIFVVYLCCKKYYGNHMHIRVVLCLGYR